MGNLKLVALGILILGSIVAGAYYLPSMSVKVEPRNEKLVAEGAMPAAPEMKGEEDAEEEPELRFVPSPELVVPNDDPPPVPLARTVEHVTKINLASERRQMDVVQVAPQRPEASGPFQVAAVIDREIDKVLAGAKIPASPLSSDAEFLRRAYLDLTGRIPPHDRAVTFLASQDPYKRSKLIDELLADPEFGKHFAHIWTDVLVKRDFENNKNLKTDAFVKWLADKFNQNTPWDKLVAELLTVTGKEEQTPAVFFYLANQDNNQPAPNKLVDTVGNLFMGIQVQCAECHRHPYNSKWGQQDFWGMAAFFGRTRLERETVNKKKTGPSTIKELDSVPTAKGKGFKPLPPGAVINIPDPNDNKKITGQATAKFFEAEKPGLGAKGPYRPSLAAWVTSTRNPYFAPAAVNRTWHHFFARGFVNPIEEMGGDTEASHPELLKALAAEFINSGYDLKYLMRAITNSNAYQRTSRPLPENVNDEKLFSHMPMKVLSARMLLDSLAVATGKSPRESTPNKPNKNAPTGSGLLRFFDTAEYDEDPTEFTYGIPQVLRMMNSNLSNNGVEVVNRLSRSAGGNQQQVLEDIFLTILSRRPLPSEVQKTSSFVARTGDPAKGYAGVFWALLNSAEFMSNH